MTRRKVQDDVETGGISLTRDEPGGWPDCCPGGIRREGGVTLNQASMWNAGTCRPMLREKSKEVDPMRVRVPMRGTGAEQPVVVMKVL